MSEPHKRAPETQTDAWQCACGMDQYGSECPRCGDREPFREPVIEEFRFNKIRFIHKDDAKDTGDKAAGNRKPGWHRETFIFGKGPKKV